MATTTRYDLHKSQNHSCCYYIIQIGQISKHMSRLPMAALLALFDKSLTRMILSWEKSKKEINMEKLNRALMRWRRQKSSCVYIYTLALVLDQTQIFVHQNRTLNILHQKIPNFKPCFARNRVAAIDLTPKSRTLNPYSFTLPNLNPPKSQNFEKTRTGFATSLSCAFHTYYMIWTVHLLWILTRCQGCDTKPQPQWFWLTW